MGNMAAGIKRPRNDSDELSGSQDYSSPQLHKRPPLLSNPPMMYCPPSSYSQPQQQPNFNNVSFSKANTFQGFEQQHVQQSFPPMEISYQQPGFPLQVPNESGHTISSQSDQRFAYHGRPPINTEAPGNYRPQFQNQIHHGGQQMEFGNQVRLLLHIKDVMTCVYWLVFMVPLKCNVAHSRVSQLNRCLRGRGTHFNREY